MIDFLIVRKEKSEKQFFLTGWEFIIFSIILLI